MRVESTSMMGRLGLAFERKSATAEGVEIRQPGKPALLLTYAAAEDFAHAVAEAEADV